jgi:hypothetical protein
MQKYQNTGYNYQPTYHGYPAGLLPQSFHRSPHGHHQTGTQEFNQLHNGDHYWSREQYSQAMVESIARDLNKRSHHSPSFAASEDRSKRKDQRKTPLRDAPMAEVEHRPDPAGQHRMTYNPYNRHPGTLTPVSPPPQVVRGLYPLEWNKGRREGNPRQNQPPPPSPFDYGSQPHDTEQEVTIHHPAKDARHFGV